MEVLFKTYVGSKLYGLSTETSDTDFKGIFIDSVDKVVPQEDNYFGLRDFKVQERTESTTGEGKDKVETTLYSLKYFFHLYLKGNPTLAEIPFATKEFLVVDTEFGQRIMKFIRENMITQHLFGGYYGYYHDQIKCFVEKSGVHREKRKELVEKFGFDTKMASHAYRIGVQGAELFTEGKITPTMTGAELDIARKLKVGGFHTRPEVIELVKELGEKMKKAKENSTLPLAPDFEKVNRFCVDLHKEYFYGKK
jgi:uncharacterized protein